MTRSTPSGKAAGSVSRVQKPANVRVGPRLARPRRAVYDSAAMLSTRLLGALTHNLKSVNLTLEPGQVVALTGVSGAGKSSLALDTLYAEGQRRFVESFSP
jgi:ABC-type transport system involved in cytochrome bd biosynthesis fused ATPase/permease subunit